MCLKERRGHEATTKQPWRKQFEVVVFIITPFTLLFSQPSPPPQHTHRSTNTSIMASLVAVVTKTAGPTRRALLAKAGGAAARRQLSTGGVSSASTALSTTTATTHHLLPKRYQPSSMLAPLLGAQVNGCVRRAGGWQGHRSRGHPSSSSSSAAGFSTKSEDAGGKKEEEEQQQEEKQQQEEEPEPEDPPEEGEKIGFMRGLAYLTVAVIAAGSLYFIVDELMPSRTSANHLFNEAFDAVKQNHEVLNRYGEPLKGYGRDGGGRREGRRNFVEHKNYVGEDGSKRLRIRFNIEGPFGHAFVFAEVTSDMPKGQWMYLLVQDMQTGRVMTLEDNRAMHEAMSKSASPEERAALQALIQSGGGHR